MTKSDLYAVTNYAGCVHCALPWAQPCGRLAPCKSAILPICLACLFCADGHVFIAPIPGRNPTGDYRRANRLSCRFVPQPDKSAWSRFGRPKDARRERPMDGAHQSRLCFRSPYQVRGRLRHPSAQKIRRDHRIHWCNIRVSRQ